MSLLNTASCDCVFLITGVNIDENCNTLAPCELGGMHASLVAMYSHITVVYCTTCDLSLCYYVPLLFLVHSYGYGSTFVWWRIVIASGKQWCDL